MFRGTDYRAKAQSQATHRHSSEVHPSVCSRQTPLPMLLLIQPSVGLLLGGAAPRSTSHVSIRMAEPAAAAVDEAFGASHTSFYTDAVKQDSYPMLEEILGAKMADKELVEVVKVRP